MMSTVCFLFKGTRIVEKNEGFGLRMKGEGAVTREMKVEGKMERKMERKMGRWDKIQRKI